MTQEYYVRQLELVGDNKVRFIDSLNNSHTVKLQRDRNNFAFFRFKSSVYYIKCDSYTNFHMIAYKRNGNNLDNALGANSRYAFNAEEMKRRGFMTKFND